MVHARCARIDISKKDAKVCVRVQGRGKRRTAATVTTWGALDRECGRSARTAATADQLRVLVGHVEISGGSAFGGDTG